FEEWLNKLDKLTRAIVRSRLARLILGNFGDCHLLQSTKGISEIRLDFGAGYRIYYGKEGNHIVILLIGGNKETQARDIEKAKRYWHITRKRNDEKNEKLRRKFTTITKGSRRGSCISQCYSYG
ncbi:type II toxin-antitoxin system RelE/ParE family toxin, partial [Candidatus Dependentiae bacterium]|nr:type II toxin-antitoxin system RelE/ParE family toxin [Candidatus Dependentiae bacterium]